VLFFVAAFLILAAMFWPYLIPDAALVATKQQRFVPESDAAIRGAAVTRLQALPRSAA